MKSFRKRYKKLIIISICFIFLFSLYNFLIYSNNPFISKWRTIYIETAMTTNSHQWLATMFIPQSVIEDVLQDRQKQEEMQKELESSWENIKSHNRTNTLEESKKDTNPIKEEKTLEEIFFETYWELGSNSFKKYLKDNPDVLKNGYYKLEVDNMNENLDIKTTNGDKILNVDVPNNTILIKVTKDSYVGRLVIVKDSSQVDVETSSKLGTKGELAQVFSERYDAQVVVNASGFKDVDGHGSGGTIKGSYVLNGIELGEPINKHWKFVGIKNDGKLYINTRKKIEISEYRWGIEFYPALIVDGENVVDGTYGMGIQPRTAIGQTKTQDFLILVVDGRQVGYSLGCTVANCRDILLKYGAYQGMNLDGGSSSIIYYKGKQINKPSSVGGIGRYMPNAIVVKKKQVSTNEEPIF